MKSLELMSEFFRSQLGIVKHFPSSNPNFCDVTRYPSIKEV